ncbi:YwgA family protein [Salipaludibacillus sp. CF4.18]|uniref:YwgA family protein n=1 Tax=Salipaludibacillus sp. CF4.18 TaxID=3373081 RepID=UPI003EE51E11
MLQEHAKIMALINQTGEIEGRKKLQKIVYIAKKMDFPFYEKYQFHMYGPYSEELTLRVEEMCELEFVTEVKEQQAGYQHYRYELSDKGREFLSVMAEGFPEETEILQEMNGYSIRFLELVSTVLYFEELSREEVTAKVSKWKAKLNYTQEDVDKAYAYIGRLRNNTVAVLNRV